MDIFSPGAIKSSIAKSDVIFARGENIFFLGNYTLRNEDAAAGQYTYSINGNYGDYAVRIVLAGAKVKAECSCPFPHSGCKHIVAACLDIAHRQKRTRTLKDSNPDTSEFLTPEEIKEQAFDAREERSKKEAMTLVQGETLKGAHTVRNHAGRAYTVTLYSPSEKTGHCTCADFATNHLETCKHLLFALDQMAGNRDVAAQAEKETFPFVHVTWNSRQQAPACHYEDIGDPDLLDAMKNLFNEQGIYTRNSINRLYKLYHTSDGHDALQFDEYLLERMEDILYKKEVAKLERNFSPDYSFLKTDLYPYQKDGVQFAVFKKSAIIADEMGLGKTIQAITIAQLKKQIFGFTKVLIVSPASLKDQWKREIEKFTGETAIVISGGRRKRQQIYAEDTSYFKITNYEAVLRDVLSISRWSPDMIILDEAQRIKNFETKTHQALISLPRNHSLVITGTPLENKLEDIYGIMQFSDRTQLTPLWAFAANHLNMSKTKKNKVLGYRNLHAVHEKLKTVVIRRTKEEVFDSLPDEIVNNYYIDLSIEQREIHQGYLTSLLAIVNKKVLTPMDIKRIQKILLSMRMVCDSTYLIDKKTNISPKLVELVAIIKDLVVENGRKLVLFSEWTSMTYLIGKVLSDLGVDFVEFTGKVPVNKRQLLINEFHENPDCKVFLSSDAGGVGINLQNADCVINFELPWNPAKLNQRTGRVNRLGQKSSKINVINLITKNSIEEKVLAGINLKQELFDAVLEGEGDEVDFRQENKNKFVNQIRAMFGEDSIETTPERQAPIELDEQTPHYLNPKILEASETEIDVGTEEPDQNAYEALSETTEEKGGPQRTGRGTEESPAEPEHLEAVLNQGMAFLNSLTQMATGKPLIQDSEENAIEIDRDTGEVVLRFKLPGF